MFKDLPKIQSTCTSSYYISEKITIILSNLENNICKKKDWGQYAKCTLYDFVNELNLSKISTNSRRV